VQIKAVQQRSGDAAQVILNLARGPARLAGHLPPGVGFMAATSTDKDSNAALIGAGVQGLLDRDGRQTIY
jgi:hypothetical protein